MTMKGPTTGILCNKCLGPTKVIDTRLDGDVILRKRQCKDELCKYQMYTIETVLGDNGRAWRRLISVQRRVERSKD